MKHPQKYLCDPISPTPEIKALFDFWKNELEKLGAEHILRWAFETFDSKVAYAAAAGEQNGVICMLLDRISRRLPVTEAIYDLLLPEKWDDPEKEYDSRPVSGGAAEYCCIKKEQMIRRYPAWIVPTIRDEDPALAWMPVLSWNERFGVFRIAPLARWSEWSIREKLRRDPVPCDLFLDEIPGTETGCELFLEPAL